VKISSRRRTLAKQPRTQRSRAVGKGPRQTTVLPPALGAKILEAAPVLILLLDARGAIQYVNQFFERLAGYQLDEIRGKDWVETFLPRRAQAGARARLQEHFGTAPTHGHVNPILTHAGEEREIEWTCEMLRGADADISWLAVGRDVTERKAAQDALRASEQRFAEAHRIAKVGAWQIDLARETEWYSDEFYRIIGSPVGTSVGRDRLPALIHPDDRELFDELVATVLAEGTAEAGFRIVRPDGEVRELSCSARTTYDEAGTPVMIAGTSQDITERKRAEEAARRASALLATVVARAPIALFALDRDGRFTLAEGRALEKLGFQPGEMVGTSALELYGRLRGFPEAFRRALAGEQTATPATVGTLEFEVVYVPSIDARGRIDGIIGVAFDMTERKQAEAELHASVTAQQRLVAELRENDRRKNDFIAILSHELRNPLSAIRSGLYVLDRASPGSDQARRVAGIITRQATQLARLVDDLLDVSRITQDKIRLQRRPLDLDDLVRVVVEDHRGLFTSCEVQLELTLAGRPVIVHGDAARLTQVLGNLLHNAAKFTPPGGVTRVGVARDADAAHAVVRVADTGAGIDPSMIGQLFEPFAQGDRTLARSMGGLGLGLTLVKGLVELHGGEVSVFSEGEDRGAEFLVRLPLEGSLEEAVTLPTGTAQPEARQVLVIEDNAEVAEVLAALVDLEGHRATIAHDGVTGIRLARELRPDIVLCDLGLPDMSGYEVAHQLARDESLRASLLVAVSGYATPEDVARARAAGFDRHLAKPIALDRLRGLLETARHQRAAASSS
jgi:PAS domain S-box-containing protein